MSKDRSKALGRPRRILLWVLVLAMAGIIFGFSCQEAPQSGELSTELAESILEKIPVFAKQPVEVKEKITFVAQEVLRSLAHFGLFFLLGLLLFLLI
ncbi:MAG: VanZ family protein, partial [Anaerovoracaceae bacterium]